MKTLNSNNKKLLLTNLLKSNHYSSFNQNKNNFKRLINDFDAADLLHSFYLPFVIPFLSEEISLSQFNRPELLKLLSTTRKSYEYISFEYEFLTELDSLIYPYKKSPYYFQNIKQENRLKRNFGRFLKLLIKEIQREINKIN